MLLKQFGDFNAQDFMNLFSKSGKNRSQKTFYENIIIRGIKTIVVPCFSLSPQGPSQALWEDLLS